jgi:hypothetical protein
MKNLTPLLDKEGRWYRVGPIPIPRGIPKRAPILFGATLGTTLVLSLVPFTPFWFLQQMDNGWAVNVVVIPTMVAALLTTMKTHGKKPERYLLSMIRFRMQDKHVTPYRKLEKSQTYTFGTVYTVRERKGGGAACKSPSRSGTSRGI